MMKTSPILSDAINLVKNLNSPMTTTIFNNLPNLKSQHVLLSSLPRKHSKLLLSNLQGSLFNSELEKSQKVSMKDPVKLNKLPYSPINFKITRW